MCCCCTCVFLNVLYSWTEPNIFLRKHKHLTTIVECVLEMLLCHRNILIVTRNCFGTLEKELPLHFPTLFGAPSFCYITVNYNLFCSKPFYTFLNSDSLYRWRTENDFKSMNTLFQVMWNIFDVINIYFILFYFVT